MTIFNLDDLGERRFSARATISTWSRSDGLEIARARSKLARNFAEALTKREEFFWARFEGDFGLIDYGFDCVVLTPEEYARALKDAFQKGVSHAMALYPPAR